MHLSRSETAFVWSLISMHSSPSCTWPPGQKVSCSSGPRRARRRRVFAAAGLAERDALSQSPTKAWLLHREQANPTTTDPRSAHRGCYLLAYATARPPRSPPATASPWARPASSSPSPCVGTLTQSQGLLLDEPMVIGLLQLERKVVYYPDLVVIAP